MDINLFFPTVIAIDENIDLASAMLPVAQKYLSNSSLITSNLEYKTTYSSTSGIEEFDDVKPFMDYIYQKSLEFLDRCGYDIDKINLHGKVFTSEMVVGDSHAHHIHPNSLLSGVFYLQVPAGSAPIVFSDTRTMKRMVSLPKINETIINSAEVPVVPKPGMLVLWESWVTHSVPKNQSVDGRITLVFNLSWV